MKTKYLNDYEKEFQNVKLSKKSSCMGAVTDVNNDNPERASMWVLHCEDVAFSKAFMKEYYENKLRKLTKEIGIIHEFMRLIDVD